jgi:formylglycine-generating enzyme required for sulfatase activity
LTRSGESEWYKAAYYDPIAGLYYDYPTGTNAVTGCVAPGSDTGNSANCWPATSPSGALTDVGAYALSDSPSGTFDQGGNVWEWHEQIKYGSFRGLRGGAWGSDPYALAVGYVGFRVASIPEPSTALLVLTGLGSLALRHRRRG